MLKPASRMPEHGNLGPWRFIVLTGRAGLARAAISPKSMLGWLLVNA
ncbi:hypothetical protein I6F26_30905 [Ensifer sp. IC3342]|nr:hypothetical protein [Ensifer sp. BRP08]MCA1450911.1 hypothetical protein [Ensifer sp. IC3342]